MCSILGYINTNLSYSDVVDLNYSMSHRGPDDSTVVEYKFKNKKLFLAHNRLAIQDLDEKANQPMENDRFVIVFNGEVYNHFEMRQELNINFRTHSDTETLLWSFTCFGIENTINKMNGMFAIALFDKINHKLYLIRDRVGIKPLYYRFENGQFSFSSDTIALNDKIRDDDSLAKFMVFGYVTDEQTYYKNIFKLKPAHYLIFDGENIDIKRYWNLPIEKIDISFDEAVDEVERLMLDSISKRLLSDVEVGSFLSGGVDSSLVSAMMAKISSKQIKTFTIGFEDKKYNEAGFAKDVAKHINSNHFEYYFKANDVLELLEDFDKFYDEPFGDASALPTMLLSKFTKDKVTVALSGDGGDELFLGYDRYFFTQEYYNRLKQVPFKSLVSSAFSFIPNDKLNKMSYPMKNLTKQNLYAVISSALKPWDVTKLFNREYLDFLELSNYNKNFESIEDFSKFDFYRYLPDDILTKVDRASMAYSLEARVPMLDYRIVEFAYSLPEDIKLFKGKKSILKEILYKYVPKEMIDRPKMGFGVPLQEWFRGELKDVLFDKVNSLDEKFNKDYILKIFDKHQKGYNYEYVLWNIMRVK